MQFEHRKPGEPYMLIAAGSGPNNVELPDGTITSCHDVKRDLGYPQLLAWKNERKELDKWVEYLREHPDCPCKLVVDSSAYSAWTRGLEIDIDEYIAYINSISDVVYWFAELDKIPGEFGGEHTLEELAEAPEYSWKNYLYMIERVNCPKKILPIFHQGEDFKYLKQMLEFKFPDGSHIEYIGISPDNGLNVSHKMKWYEKVWKIIADSSNPDVLTHNFGMTTISLMEQYPSMSSDSTSWLRSASFGNINIIVNGKIKMIYVSNRNLNDDKHINNQSPAVREAVEKVCDRIGHGITLQSLVDDEKGGLRMIFNLYVLDEWRKNFEYAGNKLFKTELW